MLELVKRFQCAVGVILNKCDLNLEQAAAVKLLAEKENIPLLACIPYDLEIPAAISRKLTAVEHVPHKYEPIFQEVWSKIQVVLS